MAACAMALTLGRPVKFVADRRESFLSDIHAREQTIRVDVAADQDGVLTAMRASIEAAVGPYSVYPRSSVVEGGQVLRLLPGPYRVRHYDGALRVVAQNKVITSQYRAVGHPIAAAVTESMIELIARDLGIDPAELRRRNLVRPEDFPYTTAAGNVLDSGSYHAALARLLEAAAYDRLRREQAAARREGRQVGIGLACFVELTGPGAQFYGVGGAPISGQEGTTVRLEPGGVVTALVGVTEQGQGTHTALAQIIAAELDVPLDRVAVRSGDTGMVPYGGGTWASRGMPIGGSATLLAARPRRADPDDRSGAPRGASRRRRTRRGTRADPWKPRAESELCRPGPQGSLPVERAARRRAEPRGDRALHQSRGVDLHQRGAPRGRRRRHRDGASARAALRGRRRLRADRQPSARGGPDRRRGCPGARRRALRALRLRRRRAASLGHVDGLRGADRSRRAADRDAPHRDAGPRHRGRLQGRRRGGRDGCARGDPQRGQRRAGAAGRDAHRPADHAGTGHPGDPPERIALRLAAEVRFLHEPTQDRPDRRGAGRFDCALSAGGGPARLRQRAGAALRTAQAGAGIRAAGPHREDRHARRSSWQGRDAVLLGHVVTDLSGGVASRPEALPGISRQGV